MEFEYIESDKYFYIKFIIYDSDDYSEVKMKFSLNRNDYDIWKQFRPNKKTLIKKIINNKQVKMEKMEYTFENGLKIEKSNTEELFYFEKDFFNFIVSNNFFYKLRERVLQAYKGLYY